MHAHRHQRRDLAVQKAGPHHKHVGMSPSETDDQNCEGVWWNREVVMRLDNATVQETWHKLRRR